jgi:hypothetical protein
MIGIEEGLLPGVIATQLDEVASVAVTGQGVQELTEYGGGLV